MNLSDQDFLRYSRQLLLEECGVEGQQKLAHSRVLIVGMGGLGSPVAQYLAASGVGKLYLADFDQVDLTNLQRQVLFRQADIGQSKSEQARKHLQELNPQVEYVAINKELTANNLRYWVEKVDVVLDCSDNMNTRHAVNQACVNARIPLISGAAVGFSGQLLGIFPPYTTGCYACLYPENFTEHLNCKTAGVLGPVVGIIGSLQALETLKYLLGMSVSCNGRLVIFDARTLDFQYLNLARNSECPVCAAV